MAHKWNDPHEWLRDYMDRLMDQPGALYSIAWELALKHDADTIQDLFEGHMDADGYFDEVKLVRCPLGEPTACLETAPTHDPCPHAVPHPHDPECDGGEDICPACAPVEEDA